MLPASPESRFVYSLFQLLLSGVLWLVYSFLLLRARGGVRPRELYFLSVAFFFYSAHLLGEVSLRVEELLLWNSPWSGPRLPFAIELLETTSLVFIFLAYLPDRASARRAALPAVAIGAVVVNGSSILLALSGPQRSWQACVPMIINLLLISTAATVHLVRRGVGGWFAAAPLVPLFLAATTSLGSSWLPSQPAKEVLELGSLALFALLLDRRSRNVYLQVFVRLNLIFILLASGLILTIIETERRHYLSFAELNLEELSEFLRGHVLYFWRQGRNADQIVTSPEITRKIVSEFGRVQALRRVRVFLGGNGMEMSISPDGTVDQQMLKEEGAVTIPRRAPVRGERISTLVRLPIVLQQTELGRIEIDESLEGIYARITDQILVVFLAFTLMAIVSGVLIGLTVREADNTIHRQYMELQKTQEQLVHAAKLASVGQLADGVAHEINNPAGIIVARTDYMASVVQGRDGYADIRDDVDAIRRQARRISEIVRGLLTFSRPAALEIRPVNLNLLVQECLGMIAPKCYPKEIELQSNLDGSLPTIQADHDRLEQVLINVLNNAVEAMPGKGRLIVETRAGPDGRATIRVTDTGKGIPEEHLKRIFDPFFTTKRADRGTGLGLSISYGIVRDHGGTIEASSRPGEGTSFEITLPIRGGSHGWL